MAPPEGRPDHDPDLQHYLRVLRKRWWLIVVALVATVAAASFQTARSTPIYRSEAKLFVGLQQIPRSQISEGSQVLVLSRELLSSYAALIETSAVTRSAVELGNLPLSSAEVIEDLGATQVGDTHILSVTFESDDPRLARRVVDAVSESFIDRVSEIGSDAGESAVHIEVVEPAGVSTTPVSPKVGQNIALGLALGLALGIALAFIADAIDLSVKSRSDVERLGLPLLGQVPTLDTHGSAVYVELDPMEVGAEAFRKLRTSIGFLSDDLSVRTILVTSPVALEGKTTVAANLAAAYALHGLSTLLVEADLRRPTLHNLFGVNGTSGLTNAILGEVHIDDACAPTDIPGLYTMLAGAIPPNPVELLDSRQLDDLLQQAQERFHVVVIDSPPLMPVADAAALSARVDGVLVVARAGKTHRSRLQEAAEVVERSGGRLLGVLLNRQHKRDSLYGYERYYSYRSRDVARATTDHESFVED